jgi:hypothetical protein
MMQQPWHRFWKIPDFYKTFGLADSASAMVDIEEINLHPWTYTVELV